MIYDLQELVKELKKKNSGVTLITLVPSPKLPKLKKLEVRMDTFNKAILDYACCKWMNLKLYLNITSQVIINHTCLILHSFFKFLVAQWLFFYSKIYKKIISLKITLVKPIKTYRKNFHHVRVDSFQLFFCLEWANCKKLCNYWEKVYLNRIISF